MVDTALDLFKRRQTAGRATVLVFYRGERSFFCKQWLRKWLSIPGFDRRLDLADVFLLFISSQSQGKAYSVADQIAGKKPILDTRVFFFGDPEHLLVDYLAESGLAHPVVTNPDSHRAHGWVFDYGMVQPAVLALAADASVLYEWTSKPSLLNVAGKLDRPDPWEVWDKIEQRIDRIRITKARAARRAIAAGSSNASAVRDGSTISSEGQSQLNTSETFKSPVLITRSTVKDSKSAKATPLSSKSFDSATLLPSTRPESPVLTESPEKEPKSAEEDREDTTKVNRTSPQHVEGSPSTNDTFSSTGGERKHSKAGSDAETATAPPSTAIDTLTVDALRTPLSREERDSSEDDMPNMRVQQFTASLNALASEVLGDKNLSLVEPEPETVAKLPKFAEQVVLRQHQPEALTDKETEVKVSSELQGTTYVGGTTEGNKNALQCEVMEKFEVESSARETSEQNMAKEAEQNTVDNGYQRLEKHIVRFTEHVEAKAMSISPVIAENVKTETVALKPAETMVIKPRPSEAESITTCLSAGDTLTEEPTAMEQMAAELIATDPVAQAHVKRDLDERGLPKVDSIPADQGTTSAAEATSSVRKNTTVVKVAPQGATTADLESSASDEAMEFDMTTSREATASASFAASRTSEMFDTHDTIGDTMETSAASLGSDQVDSTAIIVKHPSVRTEDSVQINSLAGFEGSSFPSERRIPEEADDKKTGISDYLKELKDPSKLKDPRYRSRYDPLPPMKPPGRSALPSASDNRLRPSSVSGHSYQKGKNLGASSGLAHELIQQETSMPPSASNPRDSLRRGRESRVSQRTAPPVAVFVADSELATPPRLPKSSFNQTCPEPMTASPHPELHNPSGISTVDISPFPDEDHELRMPEDLGTKSSLRDEYEAYDEYIVCEYEVEEYVEEYESETYSKSKLFVSAIVDDTSEDESMHTASEGRTPNEVHHFDHCNVVDVKGTAREADADGRVRVWKETGGRPTEAVSPTIAANMPSREAHVQSLSPVQALLRKMGVRGTRRTRVIEDNASTEEPTYSLPRDPSRISRKDTLRSVLRKTPRERITTVEPEDTADAEEEEAKLGRKETIKSVLRKIPVPKNLKRAQTEVAIGADSTSDHPTASGEDNARNSKRSGLQAVLQRLPSLSSANRQRGGFKMDTTPLPSQPKESTPNTDDTRVTREAADRNTAPMTEEVAGERPGVFRRTFSRLAQSENDTKGTGKDASPKQHGDAMAGSSARAGTSESGALDGRRKVRWGEEGEKVGAKMSFAVVGGRILSKFKM